MSRRRDICWSGLSPLKPGIKSCTRSRCLSRIGREAGHSKDKVQSILGIGFVERAGGIYLELVENRFAVLERVCAGEEFGLLNCFLGLGRVASSGGPGEVSSLEITVLGVQIPQTRH